MYQLFSEEKLIFKIQNYIKGLNNYIKTRIESLAGNTSKKPNVISNKKLIKVISEESKKTQKKKEYNLSVNVPKIKNNEAKRINKNRFIGE